MVTMIHLAIQVEAYSQTISFELKSIRACRYDSEGGSAQIKVDVLLRNTSVKPIRGAPDFDWNALNIAKTKEDADAGVWYIEAPNHVYWYGQPAPPVPPDIVLKPGEQVQFSVAPSFPIDNADATEAPRVPIGRKYYAVVELSNVGIIKSSKVQRSSGILEVTLPILMEICPGFTKSEMVP